MVIQKCNSIHKTAHYKALISQRFFLDDILRIIWVAIMFPIFIQKLVISTKGQRAKEARPADSS